MLPGRPSEHFSWAELDDPPKSHEQDARHLAEHLERLREICGGKPIEVLSGYRTERKNAQVGGARRSQHRHARAADLRRGVATVAQAERAGFTGIGSSGGWAVHVDVRPGPLARWEYI